MRRSFSPSRNKVQSQIAARFGTEQSKLPMNKSTEYQRYFCHFNNAVYMGGMSGFKKHGKGLILHDDGSAVISDYLHDTPTGHNIIFRENSIISMLYINSNEFEIAYKQGSYIVLLPFNDGSMKCNGSGVLIDYHDHKIYKLTYKKGTLSNKILHLDKKDNEDVFGNSTATKIIGVKHQQAFQLTFQRPTKLHINSERSKKVIGFYNDDGQLQGLSFTIYAQNLTTNGERPLYLKFIERGYYQGQIMHVFGQKIFTNGNKYVGQFNQGQFDGFGILISPGQMKWVYGRFLQGQLNKIQASNYQQNTEEEFLTWTDNLRSLHRRFRQRWIDLDINLPQELYLYKKLQEAIEKSMTHIDPDHQSVKMQEFNKLSRVQEQFHKFIPGVQKELDNIYQQPPMKPEPIRVQDVDTLGNSRKLQTPVNHFKSNMRSNRNISSQIQYRADDPFASDLFKRTQSSNHQYIPSEIVKEPPQEITEPRKIIDRDFLDSIRPFKPQEERQEAIHEEGVRRVLQNDILKRSLSRQRGVRAAGSPFRQTSPSKNQYEASDRNNKPYLESRYVGSVTNKRRFNYQIDEEEPNINSIVSSIYNKYPTTPKYYHPQEYTRPDKTKVGYGASPGRDYSPTKEEDNLYSRRFQTYIPRKGQERGNFIRNNYQYWT